MTTRLGTVAPDLVRRVDEATESQQRHASIRAAEFAMERSGLDDQRVQALLDLVREGTVEDAVIRTQVEELAAALDEAQWDIQDRVDAGEATVEDHLKAFGRARAAAAVLSAADGDPRIAAMESMYEASAIVDDLDELRSAVISALI